MHHHQATEREYTLEASEFNWDISDEKTVTAWGFNNQLPGPSLKALKGDMMIIKVKNNLPEPTMIHWHGIRLEASMDGTEQVQKPILPGDEFEYRFIVPDAGTFWYHSHFNETVQMEKGMYGSLIVEDAGDPIFDADKVFMIDDMKLTDEGEFVKGNFIKRWVERHDGREGQTVLLNGKENPVIEIAAGQQERWRFINAASARYIVLHLGGKPFTIIAGDGGLLSKTKTVTELMITPGERVDIIAGSFNEGDVLLLESLPYNRITMVRPTRKTLATVVVGKEKESIVTGNTLGRKVEALTSADAVVTRRIRLSVEPSLKHGIDFTVNGKTHTVDDPIVLNELQVWEVSNTSLMDHPFHLHGFFFQVLQENGKAVETVEWKDTINLKPRSKVKIAWMPDRLGSWMYHCHILEHHAAGMMGHFEVIDGSTPYQKKAGSDESHCSS